MKILANDGIDPIGKKMLEDAGFTVDTETITQDQLLSKLNQYDAVTVRSATKIRKELIDACPNLKLIGRGGVGMDNIDVQYARDNGRLVINTPAASSQSVAELVLGHMLATSRFLNDSYKNMSTGDFSSLKKQYGKGAELRGKTLLIVGFGRIGQSLATYALGCGMNVQAIDMFTDPVALDLNLGNGIQAKASITPSNDLI